MNSPGFSVDPGPPATSVAYAAVIAIMTHCAPFGCHPIILSFPSKFTSRGAVRVDPCRDILHDALGRIKCQVPLPPSSLTNRADEALRAKKHLIVPAGRCAAEAPQNQKKSRPQVQVMVPLAQRAGESQERASAIGYKTQVFLMMHCTPGRENRSPLTSLA